MSASRSFAISESDDTRPLWRYMMKFGSSEGGGGNTRWTCNYCHQTYSGSYSRVKTHLLKIRGVGVAVCTKVLPDHLIEMRNLEDEAEKMKKPKQVPLPSRSTASSHGSSASPTVGGYSEPVGLGKRKQVGDSPLEKAWNSEERDQLNGMVARMFYSGGLPFHFARNPHYVDAFKFAANKNLAGYVLPDYNLLQTNLLQKEKAHIERLLEPIKGTWKEKGVSIVSDGWTDAQKMPLINFMAASDGGPIFLKAVDGTKEYKDKHYTSSLLLDVIREVGPYNVVQIITDNAPVMKAAESLVEAQYSHIFWTPCVVHTLNLVLKNICAAKNTERNEIAYNECNWITQIADDASFIRIFIVNHSMRLAMFNEFSPLKLLAVAETRFASVIIMLKRLKLVRRGLQTMFISDEWSSYKEDDPGKAAIVKELILNDVWWGKVDYILSFTDPIYEMLRRADTDKPILHMVYEMWDSMIENVKKAIFKYEGIDESERSDFYDVVHSILVDRWTKSSTPLHCMTLSLNPKYYSQ